MKYLSSITGKSHSDIAIALEISMRYQNIISLELANSISIKLAHTTHKSEVFLNKTIQTHCGARLIQTHSLHVSYACLCRRERPKKGKKLPFDVVSYIDFCLVLSPLY